MLLITLYSSLFIPFIIFSIIIIIHECFHMIAALIFNIKPKSIELTALGGVINLPLHKLSPIQKIVVSISGVVSNLLILIFVYNISEKSFLFSYKELIISYNYSLIIFSLLPIYPLDGYNVLQGILTLFGEKTANNALKINFYISVITLITFIIYSVISKGMGLLIIGFYLIYKNISLFRNKDLIYLQNYQYYLLK